MRANRTVNRQLHAVFLSVLCILVTVPALAACTPTGTRTEQTPTPAPAATATSPAAATATPGVQAPTHTPIVTQATPTSVAATEPPAGLIYRVSSGFWVASAEGQGERIFERTDAVISPDGTQALYWEANDVWLADLAKGEQLNLTQTTDLSEAHYQWWPGRPDLVVFTSLRLEGQEKPPRSEGHLAVVGVDASGYRVLDDRTLIGGPAGRPAPSPDGQAIAYGGGTTGMLFRWETGPQVFDPRDYGLSDTEGELRIGNPSWAPDGQRLAWVVHRGSQFGIAVFNVLTRAAWMGHFYDPVGMDGFPPAVAWSPDGQWLALVAMAADPAEMGLWILASDGQREERPLGRGSNPVWSPDGNWLAFAGAPDEGDWRLWLADTAAWELRPLSLPSDAYLAGWLRP
jgi:hypothetical protein